MFDEILREMKKLSEPQRISISIPLDDKGFYDRICPNTECGGAFKVLFDDWRDKVTDECVYCPFCRYEGPSDQWHTEAQAEHIQSAALAAMGRIVQGRLQT